jgi:hypothetical protein
MLVVESSEIHQKPNAVIPMSQPDPKPVTDVSKLNLRKENKAEETTPTTTPTTTTDILALLSVATAPITGFVLPTLLADPGRERELREKEQRIRSEHPELKDVREAAMNETLCPNCQAIINPITGDGYHSPPEEPWVMICNQCNATLDPES